MGAIATGVDVLSPSERDRLLRAMASCCAEYGYRETTIDGVLEQAGLNRESFERHFDDKEDCALAALSQIVSESLAAVATAPAAETEPEQRIFQIRAILELMEARPGFARLAYTEARQGGTSRMHDAYESAVHVLSLMVERTDGGDGRHPARAARAALGGAEAVIRRDLADGKRGALTRHLPDFVYAALVPFLGQREALRQSRAAAKLLAEEE